MMFDFFSKPYDNEINPFKSFWMAGYECTDKLNAFGNRVDFLQLTGHLQMIEEDYKQLDLFEIKTVREGIRWSQVEQRPYQYNWSAVETMIEAGKQQGIQQVWDLCHFGYPDDLTPLHPMFARRFAALCRAFIKMYRLHQPNATLIVTPINEVSFISWLGGDVRGTAPYCIGQGWEVKYHLMKAYIAGIEALKEEDPGVRILTTEPLTNMVPPLDATEEQILAAKAANNHQFQTLDILGGYICPELRGKLEYLDILGFNFYYNNQWINGTGQFLPWRNLVPDHRWQPLRNMLSMAYARYQRPFILAETSHPKEDRPLWINFIAEECKALLQQGLPFWGVCWYPIIDRPDWDQLTPWHEAGLWDVVQDENNIPQRILNHPLAEAFWQAQALVNDKINISKFQPVLN